MATRWIGVLYILSFLATSVLCQLATVHYKFTEEQPARSYVGNVASDSGILERWSQSAAQNLQFSLIAQRNSKQDLFSVDVISGILSSAEQIDRETICQNNNQCRVELRVTALESSGSFFEVIPVSIDIVDSNDNSPLFPTNAFWLRVPEALTTGVKFPIPSAIDEDIGSNSVQKYDLQADWRNAGIFQLESNRHGDGTFDVQLVVIKSLDREQNTFHEVTIIARDGGSPVKSGHMVVHIEVTDANDNSPVFSKPKYSVSVPENYPIGQLLVQVTARDIDQGENGRVTYRFSPQTPESITGMMTISNVTGAIQLTRSLDYETADLFQFIVEASDGGSQSQTSRTVVIVNVTDINDNAPSITFNVLNRNNVVSVLETAKVGHFIAHMTAYDGDSGSDGRVSCAVKNKLFSLQRVLSDDYKLILNTLLDREVQSSYLVNVTCRDDGSPAMTGHSVLLINVDDVNDNKPVFSQKEFIGRERENRRNNQLNSVIITVSASDADAGRNAELSYFLEPKVRGTFVINEKSGDIRALSPLDREQVDQWKFMVFARDSGTPSYTSTATVTIIVLDKNDQTPKFTQITHMFSVSEVDPIGTVVGQVHALDGDIGQNGKIHYSLLHQDKAHPLFSISARDGIMQLSSKLDRESRSTHDVLVLAQDGGKPPLSSTIRIRVAVNDVNDNDPIIILPTNSTVNITNTLHVGATVHTVDAMDADLGANARLVYGIEMSPDSYIFNIDSGTGEIKLKSSIASLSQVTSYYLTLTVRDSGRPQRQTIATLRVLVELAEPEALQTSEAGATSHKTIIIAVVVSCAIISLVLVLVIYIVCKRGKSSDQTKSGADLFDDKNSSFYQPGSPVTSDGSLSPDANNSRDKLYHQKSLIQCNLSVQMLGSTAGETLGYGPATTDLRRNLPSSYILSLEKPSPFPLLDAVAIHDAGSSATGSEQSGSCESVHVTDIRPTRTSAIRRDSGSTESSCGVVNIPDPLSRPPKKHLQFVLDPCHEMRRSMRQLAPILYGNGHDRKTSLINTRQGPGVHHSSTPRELSDHGYESSS